MSQTIIRIGIVFCGSVLVFATPGCNQAQAPNNSTGTSESAISTRVKLTQSVTTRANDWSTETKIGQIVAERPETARVLELVGIDYCCGGQKPLNEAAKEQKVDPNQLLAALLVVGAEAETIQNQDWNKASLPDLMNHIVTNHHGWLRRELPPLLETTRTVRRVHGDSHSELAEVTKTLKKINDAVLPHLDEEEQTVFPALRKLVAGEPPADIATQLKSLRSDHDELGKELHRLRELTDGFKVPADACVKYREMLTGFTALERDMLQHVHLENNILLPRAQSMLAEREKK
jgi:regulator of cell morphogenesis and NO signaling